MYRGDCVMKQYCRYCSFLVCGDVCFCGKKKWVKTESSCKQRNKCKDFDFNSIDALGENTKGYKPRQKKIELDQETLFDFEVLAERGKHESKDTMARQ